MPASRKHTVRRPPSGSYPKTAFDSFSALSEPFLIMARMENPRAFLADTSALLIFSTALGASIEILVAGLTVQQSAGTRLAAIPVILLSGRPYGLYRDWLFRRLAPQKAGRLRAVAIDAIANLSFQMPLYVGLLALNGARAGQIASAVTTALLVLTVSGRPYGLFMLWCRKLAGV